jgi:hypothetical protein
MSWFRIILFRFFVNNVFLAMLAELAELEPVFQGLLILRRKIIDLLAIRAFEFDEIVLGHGSGRLRVKSEKLNVKREGKVERTGKSETNWLNRYYLGVWRRLFLLRMSMAVRMLPMPKQSDRIGSNSFRLLGSVAHNIFIQYSLSLEERRPICIYCMNSRAVEALWASATFAPMDVADRISCFQSGISNSWYRKHVR